MPFPKRAIAGSLAVAAILAVACGGNAAGTAPAQPQSAGTSSAKSAASPAAQSGGAPSASGKVTGDPVKVGVLCDRSGAVANNTIPLCDAMKDWIDYANNAGGGVKGRPVEYSEIDMKYEVPIGVDGYKKMTTRDGIAQILPLSTPLVDALAPSAKEDKVVLWTPGLGVSESADGAKFPYVVPGVATYNAQAMAIMQYITEEWKAQGKTGAPKVVFVYGDNPAGQDPLPLIRAQAKPLGLDLLDAVAVPATTVDMTTIMTQIKAKNPDYIMAHLFGRPPALSLTAAQKVGFPVDRMISFVWGFSENDARVAGAAATGYRGVLFHGHYSDEPKTYKLLEDYWKQSGLTPNPRSRQTLHYARGLTVAQLMLEAARLADNPNQGESLKKAIESMKDFQANEMLPGTTITPENHGGSGKVRVYQVADGESGKVERVKDWFEGPKP